VNLRKKGTDIIIDNTQLTLFGGFAPNSSSAETLSKALGNRTVMSGSVSRSKNNPSQSLQMIERPLLTAEELKSMSKGQFVVMKTGVHPMRVKLKLFYKWGIRFNEDEQYTVADNGNREVKYAEKKEIIDGIVQKYYPDWLQKHDMDDDESDNAENQEENYSHEAIL
jgi:type IV secretion system protein VirD4